MVQNHRDDCAGIADVLCGGTRDDELQGMANGEHHRDVHDGTGLGKNRHNDSDEDRGRVPRSKEKVKANGERPNAHY